MKQNIVLYLGISAVACWVIGIILKLQHIANAEFFLIAALPLAGLFVVFSIHALTKRKTL